MDTHQCGIKATGILRFYGFEHASLLPLENDQVFAVTGKQVSPGSASTMAFQQCLTTTLTTACHWRASCASDKFTYRRAGVKKTFVVPWHWLIHPGSDTRRTAANIVSFDFFFRLSD